ncbi:MAG: DUF4837 family protein [Chitinophagaceae bacterium]|nr:MAG: DUF4837 family protein [Chitinophagaceae bacterium]
MNSFLEKTKPIQNIFRLSLFCSLIILMVACEEDEASRLGMLPPAHGSNDEILVIADSRAWAMNHKEVAEAVFKRDFIGLPQIEPVFDMRHVSYDEFSNLFRRIRNIVFIATQDENTEMAQFIRRNISESNSSNILENPDFLYFFKREVWAKPQLVLFFFPKNRETLAELMENQADNIISLIQEHELKRYRALTFFKEKQPRLMNDIHKNTGIKMQIPGEFLTAKTDEQSYYWLRRDIDDASMHLFIYGKDVSRDTLGRNPGIHLRDELGKFVETPTPGAFMKTEHNLRHFETEIQINNKNIMVTRGLWRMENDFMGGPFLNYTWFDESKNKIYMVDGFVYAPAVRKRKYVRKLEAILSTIDFEEVVANL